MKNIDSDLEGAEQTAPFSLNRSNWVCIVVVFALVGASYLGVWSGVSRSIGFVAGALVGILAVAGLFALLVWRMGGRQYGGGCVTFNIVLTLFALNAYKDRHAYRASDLWLEYAQESNRTSQIVESKIPESDPRIEEPEVQKVTVESPRAKTEKARAHAKAIKSFFDIYDSGIDSWNQELKYFDLDYKTIKEDSRYLAEQIEGIERLREVHERLRGDIARMADVMRSQMGDLEKDYPLALASVEEVQLYSGDIQAAFEKLEASYRLAENILLKVLYRLRQYPHLWTYEQGRALFDNDALLAAHNRDIDSLIKHNKAMNAQTKDFNEAYGRMELKYWSTELDSTQYFKRYKRPVARPGKASL